MPPPKGGGIFRKGESMGIEDRDWYREAYRDKEKKYGSDFSSGPSYKTIQIKQKKSSGLKTLAIYVAVIGVALAIVMALESPAVKQFFEKWANFLR